MLRDYRERIRIQLITVSIGKVSFDISQRTGEQEYTLEESQKAFVSSMGHVSASVAHLVNLSRSNTPDQKENLNDSEIPAQQKVIAQL